jgi:RNA polymerase sigma-70 factor (ECF subfamily)
MIVDMDTAAETTGLVRDARAGSREAFARLVRLNQELVRTFLCRRLSSIDAADDLAQEVFLVAFRRIEEYRGDAPFSHWLLGIARNQALEFLRRESRRNRHVVEAGLAQWHAEQLSEPSQNGAEHERTLSALRDCIQALPPQSRSVVDRFYFESQPAESIAGQLDKKPGAVRMMLLRIRRALGDCVSSKLQSGEAEL